MCDFPTETICQMFSTFSRYGTDVPELTSSTLAGSRGGTPAENTETTPDHHSPEVVLDFTGGLD